MEAAHLLASLLLLLDRRLGSPTRERVVVAYFRLKGGAQVRGVRTKRCHGGKAAYPMRAGRRVVPLSVLPSPAGSHSSRAVTLSRVQRWYEVCSSC